MPYVYFIMLKLYFLKNKLKDYKKILNKSNLLSIIILLSVINNQPKIYSSLDAAYYKLIYHNQKLIKILISQYLIVIEMYKTYLMPLNKKLSAKKYPNFILHFFGIKSKLYSYHS